MGHKSQMDISYRNLLHIIQCNIYGSHGSDATCHILSSVVYMWLIYIVSQSMLKIFMQPTGGVIIFLTALAQLRLML